jgi:hypothetical protein
MYQHATYTGVGSKKTAPHLRAKHAAYRMFLLPGGVLLEE